MLQERGAGKLKWKGKCGRLTSWSQLTSQGKPNISFFSFSNRLVTKSDKTSNC